MENFDKELDEELRLIGSLPKKSEAELLADGWQFTQRPFDSLTRNEQDEKYCAICYLVGTDLTYSTYMTGRKSLEDAVDMARDYFMHKRKNWVLLGLADRIDRIEILPRGKNRYDTCEPAFIYKPS